MLLVDGDPVSAALHHAWVEAVDRFSVVGTAPTCDVAARCAATVRPDVVVVDLALAGAGALVRSRPARRVIGVTSVHLAGELAGLHRLLDDVLLKPFSFDAFADCLRR